MKKIFLIPIMAILFSFTNFHVAAEGQGQSLNLKNMDTRALPGADFYRYATGGWSDANPIPDEFARYGSFDQLRDNNQKQIQELVQELGTGTHETGSSAQKIGDLYQVGMDEARLNKEGNKPLQAQLKTIQDVKTREELIALTAALRVEGPSPFFDIYVGPDDKNSSVNILQIWQGGLGMSDRDYYLLNDKASKEMRKGYVRLIETQFLNAGFNAAEAKKASKTVLKLETTLAKAHYPKEKVRIPELNYHKYSLNQLNDSVSELDWKKFLRLAGAEKATDVNVGQPEALAKAVELMRTLPLNELKAYLSWSLINEAAAYLSDSFVNANFEFYGKQMSGAKTIRPRWKRVLNTIDGSLGEEVGKLYVARYFPAQAKERMLKLVSNLQLALGERIAGLEWMSPETKVKAQEKLNAFIVKIGYPDTWRDYSGLTINNDSYWTNISRSRRFEYAYQMNKLGKPVDKSEWLMTPQTVNAYYNPTTNEICFPAGILQPPFFYLDADDAVNYGAIGVVIGHEMSHGFDDQGCKYDKDGNMQNWWTSEDAARFEARTKVLVDLFDKIVVLGETHANGTFTLGENIADNGGLQISFQALKHTSQGQTTEKTDGFTPQQRFFLSYANLWAGNVRDAEILRLTKLDPHSLGKWRVNGSVPNIDAWYEAFDINEDSPLYLKKEERVSIW
jgi:putative endopeptidase